METLPLSNDSIDESGDFHVFVMMADKLVYTLLTILLTDKGAAHLYAFEHSLLVTARLLKTFHIQYD